MIRNIRVASTHRDKITISIVKIVGITTTDLDTMIDKVVVATTDLPTETKKIPSTMIVEIVIVQLSRTNTPIGTRITVMVTTVTIMIGLLKLTILVQRIIIEIITMMTTTGTIKVTTKVPEMTEVETMIIKGEITTDKIEANPTQTLRKRVRDLTARTITIDQETIRILEMFLDQEIDPRIRIVMIRGIVAIKISSTRAITIGITIIKSNLIETEILIMIIIVVSRKKTSQLLPLLHHDKLREVPLGEMITRIGETNLLISLSCLITHLALLS